MSVTTFEDLVKFAEGEEIELPPFIEGQKFIARVRKPSIMAMSQNAYGMNNELMEVAHRMFFEENAYDHMVKENQPETMRNLYEFFNVLAKECLISPTYEEIEKAGLKLTDSQLMSFFSYSQYGVKGLIPFRTE